MSYYYYLSKHNVFVIEKKILFFFSQRYALEYIFRGIFLFLFPKIYYYCISPYCNRDEIPIAG